MSSRRIRRREAGPLSQGLGEVEPLLARIYSSRGLRSREELCLDLKGMIPVAALAGAESAVDLLVRHREEGGRILIVGDFDADGATSTAVMVRALTALGYPDVRFLVPNRFEFGYGLSPELVDVAREDAPSLIITVDNGISSVEGVDAARKAGIEVLVTDHHLAPDLLPDAHVIVNPNLPGEPFPSKHLAGVGVAFYLVAALARRLKREAEVRSLVAGLLDLVAVGTVADVVTLDLNNRILVEQGLRRIRAGRCVPGITALLTVARKQPDRTVASDLGYAVGPRLNAAGRLDDIGIGIRCLLADDPAEAFRIAEVLDELNRARRTIEADMQTQAMEAVGALELDRDGDLPCALCLYDESWHEGVVGLVASRVKERVHRPVVAFAPAVDGMMKGSARSIPGLHIRDALAEVDARHPGLIRRFGGHAMAAGLTLSRAHLDRFSESLEEVASRSLDEAALEKVILTDGEMAPRELRLETAEMLRTAGPWGQGFPEPLFDGEFRVCSQKVMAERHLRLRVCPMDGRDEVDAVAFNQADELGDRQPSVLRLVYRPDVNLYRGFRSLQLIVEHMEIIE